MLVPLASWHQRRVRDLAAELGPKQQVRVNAISAGPIRTLTSSAIGGILEMIHNMEAKAPCAAS